jgi:sucrose-6F-phosphate phosphohydrolase
VPALAVPDVLICSVGTEIYYESATAAPAADAAWGAALDAGGWDRGAVAAAAATVPALALQPASEQRPHKASFTLAGGRDAAPAALAALDAALASLPFRATVIHSGGVDVDILPAGAGKGAGLAFLLERLAEGPGAPTAGVLVAGDSGNDVDLFAVPGVRGAMVSNAHAELRGWVEAHGGERVHKSGRRAAGAICDALAAFGWA